MGFSVWYSVHHKAKGWPTDGEGKASLRRMQGKSAQDGNVTAQIWLGKQMLGQRDKHELSGPDGGAVQIEIKRTIVDPAP